MTNTPQCDLASDQRVAIVVLANELGCYKQTIFKIVRRLGIVPWDRRESARRNQMVKTISFTEAEVIRSELRRSARTGGHDGLPPAFIPDERGVFYVIQLEPEH